MLRKLALSAVVALVPGLALAATAGTNGPASTDTHVTGTEVKSDAAVKADAKDAVVKSDSKDSAVKTEVKSDAAVKSKAVHHRAGKAAVKGKTDTKAGTDSKS